MSFASVSTGHWHTDGMAGPANVSSAETSSPQPGETWDAMETYFECITTCSLEDGECVTRCVEELRERA
jgi:hypothetical protein